jgi:hypothetical protein
MHKVTNYVCKKPSILASLLPANHKFCSVSFLAEVTFLSVFKSHSPWAKGFLLMEILSVFCVSVCDNFEPCDWSVCPKARFSLVENWSNVSEVDYSTNLHKLVLTDKPVLGRN